jgi:hypothetical protein
MAKGKSTKLDTKKVTFGKKRRGKAKKSHNKHDRTERNYRGQGR